MSQSLDTLRLKDGSVFPTTVTGIDSSIVYSSDHEPIRLKAVSSIITWNQSVVEGATSLYPSVSIVRTGPITTLSFDNVSVAPVRQRSRRAFRGFSCLLNYQTDNYESAEIQLCGSLAAFPHVIVQVTASTGLNFATDADNVHQASLGAGYQLEGGTWTLLPAINVGEKQINIHTEGKYSATTVFVSLYLQPTIIHDRLFLSFGSRYYFRKLFASYDSFSFNLGIGLRIAIEEP